MVRSRLQKPKIDSEDQYYIYCIIGWVVSKAHSPDMWPYCGERVCHGHGNVMKWGLKTVVSAVLVEAMTLTPQVSPLCLALLPCAPFIHQLNESKKKFLFCHY